LAGRPSGTALGVVSQVVAGGTGVTPEAERFCARPQ